MEKKKTTITTITESYELSTDDIEEIIGKHLKLPNNAEFDWSIGQWVSLNIKTEKVSSDD